MEFLHQKTAQITGDEIQEAKGKLEPYFLHLKEIINKHDFSAPEASLCLPHADETYAEVMKMLERHQSNALKHVFLIGIGGSNLGAKALYDALRGPNDMFASHVLPKMIFLDTISAHELEAVLKMIDNQIGNAGEVIVNIVSKSGMTLETIANSEIVLDAFARKFGNISKQIIVTTDSDSQLDRWAKSQGIDALHIPHEIGGRFSVFSPAGLFPLGLCGFNIQELLLGARKALDSSLGEITESPAFLSAASQFINYKKGKVISDSFFFASELESLGKWVRQLMAESLGKEKDSAGKIVHMGFTPTVSIGSTDLHSIAQLTFGGPQDKYTNLITIKNSKDIAIPHDARFAFLDANIANKTAGEIMAAIYGGVKAAYEKAQLPFSEIIFQDVSEQSIGEYMQFKMIETMLLGRLMNVNAFDQPAVESYKIEMRRLLNL